MQYRIFSCFFVLFTFLSCSKEEYFTLEGMDSAHYIIAHRGSWRQNHLPQNSRAAFKEALALDIFGVEFDVRQTKDGVLIINHDPYIEDAKISESSNDDISSYSLNNGEKIPTLDDFFSIYISTDRTVKLIIELKECNVEDVVSMVDKYNARNDSYFTVFNKEYCDKLVELGLGNRILFVGGESWPELEPNIISELGYAGFAYKNSDMQTHKEWVGMAKTLGLIAIAWTEDDLFNVKQFVDDGVVVMTNKPYQCAKKKK